MTAVRHHPSRGPTLLFEHFEGPQVLDQSIGKSAIELQPVAVRAHAAVAQQVAGILMREKIFTCGHWRRVMSRQFRLQSIIEWVTGFFIPEESIAFHRL